MPECAGRLFLQHINTGEESASLPGICEAANSQLKLNTIGGPLTSGFLEGLEAQYFHCRCSLILQGVLSPERQACSQL